jgi:hypothetical protein
MACAVQFMQWDNYTAHETHGRFFDARPLTFNSRQERLHQLHPGDRLCLVSRCPQDGQYYFVAVLHIASLKRNPLGSTEEQAFGEFAVVADRSRSMDLDRRFPAEALLRAFQFDPGKPIKYGASIGQALQTLRLLEESDERILDAALQRLTSGNDSAVDRACGLWTKCGREFADYFLTNWTHRHEPLAFLLYDPPPTLHVGAPVFIHSEKNLRLLARFREGQFLAGHKPTTEPDERVAERERVWRTYRATTIDAPIKTAFDSFWDGQDGVRGLFIMDEVILLPKRMPFGVYGRALQWGYPTSVGYRYLTLAQCALLFRGAKLPATVADLYLKRLIESTA